MLLVDRDKSIRSLVARALEDAGHDVAPFGSVRGALGAIPRAEVIITDTMDASLAGIRALVLATPIDASEDARVSAFEAGADDVVPRPFSVRELVLRVRALLRRRKRTAEVSDVLEYGGLRIDRGALRVWIDERAVALTTLELRVLLYLTEHAGRTVTRERLLEDVWGDGSASVRVVDTSVRRLRRKLGPARYLLRTLRNVGYQLRAEADRRARAERIGS